MVELATCFYHKKIILSVFNTNTFRMIFLLSFKTKFIIRFSVFENSLYKAQDDRLSVQMVLCLAYRS
jgi:hypothetical protein